MDSCFRIVDEAPLEVSGDLPIELIQPCLVHYIVFILSSLNKYLHNLCICTQMEYSNCPWESIQLIIGNYHNNNDLLRYRDCGQFGESYDWGPSKSRSIFVKLLSLALSTDNQLVN